MVFGGTAAAAGAAAGTFFLIGDADFEEVFELLVVPVSGFEAVEGTEDEEDDLLAGFGTDGFGSGFSFLEPTLKKFKLGGSIDVPGNQYKNRAVSSMSFIEMKINCMEDTNIQFC